jgi:arylsulfatase A-like enzyme
MEGSLRVPFIIRWPGKVPAGRMSNEIVHEVDTFTTFAKIAGAAVPQDRAIDGVDQTDFLIGKSEKSNREGFPVFVADRLEAVKWRNLRMAFYEEQRDWWTPPTKLGVPKLFDLITDPKEEYSAKPRLRICIECVLLVTSLASRWVYDSQVLQASENLHETTFTWMCCARRTSRFRRRR